MRLDASTGRPRRAAQTALGIGMALAIAFAGSAPATAAGGHRQWVATSAGRMEAVSIAASPSGDLVFVTGPRTRMGSSVYATVAYHADTGKLAWLATYDEPGGQDTPVAVAVSPDGSRVYVTGTSDSAAGGDFATVAYDASSGAQLWVSRYDDPSHAPDRAFALGVSPDGSRVFVTGAARLPASGFATVAYDAETGAQLWAALRHRSDSGNIAFALAVSPDSGRVYVTGSVYSAATFDDYDTVAYDAADGSELWSRRFNRGDEDVASSIGVSPDGSRVYVTGASFSTSFDYATLAYDAATGDRVWKRIYDGTASGDDRPSALTVSPDGTRVYVTGRSEGAHSYDFLTLAYDTAGGGNVWKSRFNGPGDDSDWANAMAVSPDGASVFVTGLGSVVSGFNYATLGYNAATGAREWTRTFNGTGNRYDEAKAIAVAPDGAQVYVTGQTWTFKGSYSFGTIAYDTG